VIKVISNYSLFVILNYMRWVKGKTAIKHYPRTASTTFTAGNMVRLASGLVATATASSTKHLGIGLEDVASTDSDFATDAVLYAVEVPLEPTCEFEADVTNTLVTTNLGSQFDLSNSTTVNRSGTTSKVVTCKGYISASKGRFSLNSNLDFADPSWE
jgi:hypothetical protein